VLYRKRDAGEWRLQSRLRQTAQVDEYREFIDRAETECYSGRSWGSPAAQNLRITASVTPQKRTLFST